jgi:glycosyltransferase involved in cell wall biosynthesis
MKSRRRSGSIRNIGFVSTRVSGTDGVSLEVGKWAEILGRMGYECYYICGVCDRPAKQSFLIEEADFQHPIVAQINQQAFGNSLRTQNLSDQIRDVSARIKHQLYNAFQDLSLDLIIAQNALTIPMNIPLGVALVEVIIETGIPCIAHHHDFVWERERFLINSVDDYLGAVFPPPLAEIDHVVINTLAGEEFSRRTGLNYRVIPNVMDFAHPPQKPDSYGQGFRKAIGIAEDDILILQPTRVVQRKGIEHTIELVRRLDDPRCKLVISHDSNDEGDAYLKRICSFAEMLGVEIIFADSAISEQRGIGPDGRPRFAIWDVFPHADLVAYPSTYEGFGNAFLEALYYKKPVFCNRYTIFRSDIEPCGFHCVVMDGYLTDEVVQQVRQVLDDEVYRRAMVERNYRLGERFFSYDRVERELTSILERPRPTSSRIRETLSF